MAVVLAVILPIFIPTLHLDGLGLFGPGGDGDGVKVVNPITDMRRNLHRGKDIPLLRVKTDDPDPSYLRIAVLTTFNGVEWTSGDRAIIQGQTASGLLPYVEQGLDADRADRPAQLHGHRHHRVRLAVAADDVPGLRVNALGDWHWDGSTMDFIAANDSTNTAGLTWTMTAAKPELHQLLDDQLPDRTAVDPEQRHRAAEHAAPYVAELAHKVTKVLGPPASRWR